MPQHAPPVVRPGETLCRLDALDDPPSKAFTVALPDGGEVEIFVVRRGGDAVAYVNDCPHQHLPLNWKTDVFLTLDRARILCVMHAATFDIASGEMLSGPHCPGCRLTPVPVRVADGAVILGESGIPRLG